jgi:NADPH-dependent ferric siderophore reductase
MSEPTQPTPRRRPPPRRVVVSRVEQLTPHLVRITFSGETLSTFTWNGPAAYIKVILPEEGQTEPIPPSPDGPRPTMRTYTPRRFDPNTLELDVDFVLHGHGPASKWAAQAAPGQVVLIGGPGPHYEIDASAERFVIAGDESALPAIATILEALPASANATVLIEIADVNERIPLISPANIDLQWLQRNDTKDKANVVLEATLRALPALAEAQRVYVACEAKAVRRIRSYLLNDRNFAATNIVTRGYWQRGEVNHPDHDYGIDCEDGRPVPPQRRG